MATKTKSKRTSRTVLQNISLDEAQKASETWAKAQNSLSSIEAKMNAEIDKIKSKYSDKITELKEELEEPEEILAVYASENRTTWGKLKSLELVHTRIGFRTSPSSVAKSKKVTWEFIAELLQKAKKMSGFVRVKAEVNKEAVLAVTDEKLLKELNDDYFLSIEQKETFFVEAKKEEVAA